MNGKKKNRLAEQLLDELNQFLQEFYHQTLEEVVTDLKIRCLIDSETDDPNSILVGIQQSGLFYQIKNDAANRIRNAIERYMNNEIGTCINCEQPIPEDWITRNPLVEYCSSCLVKMIPTGEQIYRHEEVSDFASR